ncbi:Ltp family lipoprotein [Terrabacter sp. 2YAF2]|uniref:Ltp family lipoprotein n=1 Tax=Terrabacter sp. 2YAF2 TaxID=3233026 RepID=UPI003F9CA4F7
MQYEQFSRVDATFAADHVTVDWNEQAAKKAKSYLEMTAFSRGGLIDQLRYEGFTSDQAGHGATAAGL